MKFIIIMVHLLPEFSSRPAAREEEPEPDPEDVSNNEAAAV